MTPVPGTVELATRVRLPNSRFHYEDNLVLERPIVAPWEPSRPR